MFTIEDKIGNSYRIWLHATILNAPIIENSILVLASSEKEKKIYIYDKYINAQGVQLREFVQNLPKIVLNKKDTFEAKNESMTFLFIVDREDYIREKNQRQLNEDTLQTTMPPLDMPATSPQPTTELPATIPPYVSPRP